MQLFIHQTMGHCLILNVETQIVFEASRLPNTAHKQAERKWLFCLWRQNSVFPLFGLELGLGLGLGLF